MEQEGNKSKKSKRKEPEAESMQVEEMDHKEEDKSERRKKVSFESGIESEKLPVMEELQCLVKVYGDAVDQFKLNEVVEFVGVLSITPQLSSFTEEEDEFMLQTPLPPSSLLPRVHCLSYKKIGGVNLFIEPADVPKGNT